MKVVASPDELELSNTVISIGNFDGVHLGHQMLLGHMHDVAAATSAPGVVITFFPPSRVLFQNGKFLSSEVEKVDLLAAFAPDAVVMVPFTPKYTQTPKDVFLKQLERLSPQLIIVGEDFRFGFNREGSLNDLSRIAGRLEVFNLKHAGEAPISSTRIRELLQQGDVESVKPLLGRAYATTGTVVEGDKRGRTIGFPTANVATSEHKALPLGVFAVTVTTEQGRFGGMANVGPRPSYPDGAPSLEVYLFDFRGNLYGQTLTTHFEAFLRSQVRFSGLDELKAQLARDEETARGLLGGSIA